MMTKTVGRTAPWMILALILAGAGVWLAGRVATTAAAGKPELGPPTAPTKVAERKPRDPVAHYDELSRKGMTVSQVRSILLDFHNSGLDAGDQGLLSPQAVEMREKSWYLDALAAGLTLDSTQRAQARKALQNLPKDGPKWAEPDALGSALPEWLQLQAAAPWALCQLSDAQRGLTRFAEWQAAQKANAPWSPLSPVPVSAGSVQVAEPPDLPGSGFIFPLRASQDAGRGKAEEIERRVMALHPAQFELLLLLEGVPDGLEARLDDSSR